ncbi:unnamed protein product [Agarophyton chilense]|eukprot:gb/GEZJ01002259.1/.p1 GENE.gb/GEZJ01002259.1/~~gb/GEZJ01002259.1/.p1  ORF type:complete len:1376 (+),score=168.11 gb/GEZJ01002259.1/:365-4492(+)
MRAASLLCTVLAICISLTSAQPSELHLAFARSFMPLPTPYTAIDITKLSPGAGVRSIPSSTVAAQFRSYATRNGDFSYTAEVAPGRYTVTLGFAELLPSFCQTLSSPRLFTAVVNGVTVADDINVAATVGCDVPYQLSEEVDVLDDGQLLIELKQGQGPPMLATADVVAVAGSAPTPVVVVPTPSASASSAAVMPSPSASASTAPVALSPSASSSSVPLPSPSTSSAPVLPSPSSSTVPLPSASASQSSATVPSPSSSSSTVPLPSASASQSSAPIPSPSSSSSAVPLPSASASQSSAPIPSPSSSSSTVPLPSASASQSSAPIPSPSSSASALPPSPSPSSSPAPAVASSILIDVGSNGDPAVAGTTKYSSSSSISGTTSISGGAFQTGRSGTDFTYSFDLQPGAYDITLGFAEYTNGFCSEPGKRVFNIYVSGEIQIESLDIYDTVGCFKGLEEKVSSSVGSVITEPITIRFEAIVGAAIVSYISVSPKPNGCIPASSQGGLADGEDHAAHAVPGAYPPQINANSPKSYVDSDGDGFQTVRIDGSGSHSHFFDNANNIIGDITEYTWTLVETGEVLSKDVAFTYTFPLGTTRLKLAVVDNSCTTDEAETTVTVTGSIQQGMYCYYYNGLSMVMGGDPLGFPQFSAISSTPNLGFPSFSFNGGQYVARCFFFLEIDAAVEEAPVSVSAGGGTARVYKGEDLLLDTDGMASTTTELAVGLLALEIIFERTAPSATAAVQFKVSGSVPAASKVFYDQKAVKPILAGLTPSDGPDSGGTSVKVTGYGLFQPLTVSFGGTAVTPGGTINSEQFFVTSPPSGSSSIAQVSVTSGGGLPSNSLEFSYGSTCDSIGFDSVDMKTSSGGAVDFLELPTCVTIGGDGKLYMGTLGATVQVLGYDPVSLTVNSHCYSKSIFDNNFKKGNFPSQRDILGITFDPRDATLKPYVSTSTLYWYDRNRVDLSNKGAWRNGAIDRLKKGSDPGDAKVCLVYDQRIVTGLPVSNHDHGVNQVLFTQSGDLLIAVGGFTNAGLPQYKLGNFWENPLSAALVVAKLSKGGQFDGNIQYSNPDVPRLSQQISGDVSIYSPGLRNLFGMAMAGSGNIYGVDQGPNCDFGDTSTTCSDYDEAAAESYDMFADTTWPGMVQHGCASFPFSIGRPDKVVHLTQGSWYGHPNIQRGGSQCAWIDPFDHKTADDKPAPSIYKQAMATVKSSVTGIGEYRSDHFCGALRGDIIMSTHKGGTIYRMGVNGGSKTSGPDGLASGGGTAFIENAHGDLIFPMLREKRVFVLRPKVSTKGGIYIANAVPWRHGKAGGTSVVIGGQNFGASPSVTIAGSPCPVSTSSDKEIICKVPSSSAGLKDVVVNTSAGSATLSNAILYMNV